MKRIAKFILVALLGSLSFNAIADKKPLDHSVYDGWQNIPGFKLSTDGSLIAWEVACQEGDGTLYIRNLKSGKEISIPRGSGINFNEAADWAVCTVKVPFKVSRQERIDKVKDDKKTKDSTALINLKTFEYKVLGRDVTGEVKGLHMPAEKTPYIFVSVASKDDAKNLKDLVWFNPATPEKRDTVKNVSDVLITPEGQRLVYVTVKNKKDSLSKSSVVYRNLLTDYVKVLDEGKRWYGSLRYNSDFTKLVFCACDQDGKKVGTASNSIIMMQEKVVKKATKKAPAQVEVTTAEVIAPNHPSTPEGWVVTGGSKPRFSNKDSRLILDLEQYYPAKDSTLISFELPGLDIWRWDAETTPPQDKRGAHKRTRCAVINLDEPGKLVVLSANGNEGITFFDGGEKDFAVAKDRNPYFMENTWGTEEKSDLYIVNLRDGSRKLFKECNQGNLAFSPYGNYLMWFNQQEKNWYSWNIATGEKINITGKIEGTWWNKDRDVPVQPQPAYGPQWTKDPEWVILVDRYDMFMCRLDGTKHYCMTNRAGQRDSTSYSVYWIENHGTGRNLFQDPYLPPTKGRMYVKAFNMRTKENGVGHINIGKPEDPQVKMMPKMISNCQTAKFNTDIMAARYGDFQHPNDLYVTSDDFRTEQKLSAINPQQADYLWGTAKLVHWNAYDGTKLDGNLYIPENLDPDKKYPMMIYFYEKNSQNHFQYFSPGPSRSIINIPCYVSRGYVVFVPDIVYKDGHPGESAYNCICSGAEAMCEQFSFIDKSRMAIQGQSWGGYQTAYLITRTDMFKCGGAGAPVSNMTSAYGGIRWGTGNSRIYQYEHGQSRIGKTLWEDGGFELYVENSPVFHADKVNTPLLIMHNDNDGAVPWYQGIEYFMALRRLGKPCWMLTYNGDGHNLTKRNNSRDLSIRLEQFFDYYLMGKPMPAWMKTGIPWPRKGNYFATEYAE